MIIFSPLVFMALCSFVCLGISVYLVCNKMLSVLHYTYLKDRSLEIKVVKRHCMVYYFRLYVD